MDETKVTPEINNAKSTVPDLVFWEPITDLMAASNSLDHLADQMDHEHRFGESNVLRLIGKQIMEIACHMDDGNWKAEGGAQ